MKIIYVIIIFIMFSFCTSRKKTETNKISLFHDDLNIIKLNNYQITDSGYMNSDNPSDEFYRYTFKLNNGSSFSIVRGNYNDNEMPIERRLKIESDQIKLLFSNYKLTKVKIDKINNFSWGYIEFNNNLENNIHMFTIRNKHIYRINIINDSFPNFENIINSMEFN